MHWINWAIVGAYLLWVVGDGIRRSRGATTIEGYFLAGRSLPWWAVGLSVMATQLSAITLIGTTGQGATDGLRFVQFYFGLPIAMVILGVTLVPFLINAKVYTAYEYLERRFNPATRSLTSLLFLLSRGMSCGTIIAAPAVVLSAVLGLDLWISIALIGIPTIAYTAVGGVGAVTWADVKQMVVIVAALFAVVVVLISRLPIPLGDALSLAGSTGKLNAFDFSFSITNTYTFWSGLIGGTFLMLSYFGADQSQVQRYLAAKSVDEARSSLLMSAYWKIPLQALVLLVGIGVFLFYVFTPGPLLFNPAQDRAARAAAPAEFAALDARYADALSLRAEAARANNRAVFAASDQVVTAVRSEALATAQEALGRPTRDVNYIIPRFVTDHLPIGLAGLFLAAVLAAAMSSIAAELNSLATASTVDFYIRWINPAASESQNLRVGKLATMLWGTFACVVALKAATLGSLIEVVNRFGSFFYGSILGVFLLAMIPRARGLGAFVGLLAGMGTVAYVATYHPAISFLWHNVIGAVTVVTVGMLLSLRPAR
ncbi:MAG: sodium:solute symporter [Gemmatimonadaceae bacterium]|nr:sodium:solute symporter [Gemmatimonadaceae bacterium]MCW5826513.1 sodium:solute symporter [Gemmatimonadaceae bacterium]